MADVLRSVEVIAAEAMAELVRLHQADIPGRPNVPEYDHAAELVEEGRGRVGFAQLMADLAFEAGMQIDSLALAQGFIAEARRKSLG